MKTRVALLMLLPLAFTAACSESSTQEAAQPAIEAHVQDVDLDVEKPGERTAELPSLKVQTLDGKAYDLAAHRGKWVVVNFWATWCAPCLKEMPDLSALDKANDHIEVIGLAYEEIEPDDLKAFLEDRPVVYPVAILDVYNPPADFATPRGLPLTYLVGPDGRVAKQFLGPVTGAEILAVVNSNTGA